MDKKNLIKNKMADKPNKEIDIDMFFNKKKPGTPPQLQASIPLNSCHSQPMVAADDDEKAA